MDETKIKDKLKNHFMEIAPTGEELEFDTDLLNDWFIDSFAVVQIVMFLESEFQLELAPDDINEDNFFSIDSLSSFVKGLLA